MGEDMLNRNPKFGIRERMLVIVNNDWHRTYVASVKSIKEVDGKTTYSATCKMKESTIVGIAKSKTEMSPCMDELATIIEEYTSRKLSTGVTLSKEIHCAIN